jgi:hypothetical protein
MIHAQKYMCVLENIKLDICLDSVADLKQVFGSGSVFGSDQKFRILTDPQHCALNIWIPVLCLFIVY